jgi:hypothetical protein
MIKSGDSFMKTLIITVLFLLLSATTAEVFANGCTTIGSRQGENYVGKTHCQKAVLAQLTVNGDLDIDRVKVNGDVAINGLVEGYDFLIKGSLTINGKTTLNTVKAAGSTTIHGQTTLSNTDFQNLTVSGKLNASGSKFADTKVNGSVNLRDVVIKGSLTARTSLAILNGVEVKKITIMRSKPNTPQIICLEKASRVQGDINFEAGNGKVYTIGASKIIGKVMGGNVIQGQCPNQGEVTIQ